MNAFQKWLSATAWISRQDRYNNPFFSHRVYIVLYLVSSAVLLPVSLNYAYHRDWPVALAIGGAALVYALLAGKVWQLGRPGYTSIILFLVASTVTLGAAATLGPQAAFWLFPLILTAYLLFTLWIAVALNAILLIPIIAIVVGAAPAGFAVQAVATVILVSLFSLLFAFNVHNSQQELARLSYTDHLTGLLNRRRHDEMLEELLERNRTRGETSALLAVDLDYFKAINDRWGHSVGDDVLEEFADRLRAVVRENDHVFRIGGEEFMVVLPGADLEAAQNTAERLRNAVESALFSAGLSLTVSCGVAALTSGETTGDWMRRADAALYSAKSNGRNRVEAA